ncbi:discoidin domain-containing protein [Defluviimonas sp. CAU 1641]|uniref:Discoidin domain-containing protein n=2 Tax=Defluviimonas salinarum TaxID=2992147 RepID=A0ABT3J828_9RHOB|nr:discoidin domain-containing protein [Defluviimonas salinarum]
MKRKSEPMRSMLPAMLLVGAFALPAWAASIMISAYSIDEVAGGALPEVSEVTAIEAIIVFRSSQPLACSVVFGESPDFGRIAVDDDMNGGAHSDHHPVLSGLTPDTEYFYRVQGTGHDGKLYVGDVRSFRTLQQAAAQPNLADLSEGARIRSVSSNFGGAANDGAWGANAAIDGNRATAWSSNGDGDGAFIEIELSKTARIGEVAIWSRSMADGTSRIASFTLTDDADHKHGPFVLPDTKEAHRFPLLTETRTLRLDVVESTGGNTGLVEFSVFPR